jgi:hypothetical protein
VAIIRAYKVVNRKHAAKEEGGGDSEFQPLSPNRNKKIVDTMISNIYLIYISVEINNRNRLMTSVFEFLKIK